MTTDVFIAGTLGMTLIALVIAVVTFRRDRFDAQKRDHTQEVAFGEK